MADTPSDVTESPAVAEPAPIQPATARAPAPIQPATARAPASVDPALAPALDRIRSVNVVGQEQPFGDTHLSLIGRLGIRVAVGPLPKGTSGRYTPVLNTIVVNAAAMDEDPRAIAAVIVHELTHAGQVKILGEGGERDCVHMEVDAFRVQSLARSAFWEDDPPAGTGLERELSWIAHIVATDGEPGLYKLVVDTPGYQQECELFVPDGAGPRTAQPGAVRWPTVLLVPPTATRVPSTPTPAGSRLTSDLAARCYTLAFAIGSEASAVPSASPATDPIGSPNKSIDTLTAVNAQCRDIADKYGGPGVDCYEPAARAFWRTGAVLMADRSQTGEVANSAFVGRVATCLRDLPR